LAKRAPDLIDPRLAKAVEHPLRVDILRILGHGPSSPARIERQLENVSLNLVSHHMKVLTDLGCIELVETVSKRGSKEHIYRASKRFVFNDEDWKALTPGQRQRITVSILRVISEDLADALVAGKFDEFQDTHLTRSPLRLDREGWSEAGEVLFRALGEVLEIGSKSLKRIEASGEAAIPTTIALMQFPTVERAADGGDEAEDGGD
jgi:DNA-binding transcriptional ArsR family regulator